MFSPRGHVDSPMIGTLVVTRRSRFALQSSSRACLRHALSSIPVSFQHYPMSPGHAPPTCVFRRSHDYLVSKPFAQCKPNAPIFSTTLSALTRQGPRASYLYQMGEEFEALLDGGFCPPRVQGESNKPSATQTDLAARRFASSKVLSFTETEDGDSQFMRMAGSVVPLMGGMVVRIRTENPDPLEADTFNWARVSAVSDDGRAVEVDVEKDGASETEEVARARVVVPRSDLFAASALLEREGDRAATMRYIFSNEGRAAFMKGANLWTREQARQVGENEATLLKEKRNLEDQKPDSCYYRVAGKDPEEILYFTRCYKPGDKFTGTSTPVGAGGGGKSVGRLEGGEGEVSQGGRGSNAVPSPEAEAASQHGGGDLNSGLRGQVLGQEISTSASPGKKAKCTGFQNGTSGLQDTPEQLAAKERLAKRHRDDVRNLLHGSRWPCLDEECQQIVDGIVRFMEKREVGPTSSSAPAAPIAESQENVMFVTGPRGVGKSTAVAAARDSAAVKGISDMSVVKIDCNKARPDEPSVLSKMLRILTPSEAIGDGDGDKELISLQALPRLPSFTVFWFDTGDCSDLGDDFAALVNMANKPDNSFAVVFEMPSLDGASCKEGLPHPWHVHLACDQDRMRRILHQVFSKSVDVSTTADGAGAQKKVWDDNDVTPLDIMAEVNILEPAAGNIMACVIGDNAPFDIVVEAAKGNIRMALTVCGRALEDTMRQLADRLPLAVASTFAGGGGSNGHSQSLSSDDSKTNVMVSDLLTYNAVMAAVQRVQLEYAN